MAEVIQVEDQVVEDQVVVQVAEVIKNGRLTHQ